MSRIANGRYGRSTAPDLTPAPTDQTIRPVKWFRKSMVMHKAQWRLQDAKTQFSQVVEAALHGEPQHVNRRGRDAVVVLSEASYRALRESVLSGAPGFVAHLLAIPKGDEQPDERRDITLREIEL